MPSSTEGVYQRTGNLIDYYGNPIDLSKYNLLGPTGPEGATGQDLFFVSGGTGTIERILPNVFVANDTSVPTSLIYNLNLAGLLEIDGQIIKFTSVQSTEDSTGYLLASSIVFENLSNMGATSTQTLFTINNDPSIQGMFPAKIKVDKDPNSSPSGYGTSEKINWIESDFEISRSGSFINIRAKIYSYNSEVQFTFGQARFPQKTWILTSGGLYNSLCNLRFVITPDGSGTSLGIRNILRFNAF
jgi:hypothetical protein